MMTSLFDPPVEQPHTSRGQRFWRVLAVASASLPFALWLAAVLTADPPFMMIWWLIAPVVALVLLVVMLANARLQERGRAGARRTALLAIACLASLVIEFVTFAFVPFGPYC